MTSELREAKCVYCKKIFKTYAGYKIYCCHNHRNKYYNIIKRSKSELFKLDEYDLKIWKEYYGDKHEQKKDKKI